MRRRPFVYLTLHFFRRFFDSELSAAEGETGMGLGAILAILAVPGLLLPLLLFDKYSPLLGWIRGRKHFDVWAASISDEYLFVNFAMTVIGLMTVLKWDSLFPDRRDFANLSALPTGLGKVLGAKALALAALVVVFTADVNGASAILFPFVVATAGGTFPEFVRFIWAHSVAVGMASAFTFFFFLTLAGGLMSVLPARWFQRVSRHARTAAIVALLASFFTSFTVSAQVAGARAGTPLGWLPQTWFVGLAEALLAKGAPAGLTALAGTAWRASALAMAAGAAAYGISYRRYFLRIPETLEVANGGKRGAGRWFRWADGWLLRTPFERAAVRFLARTTLRSERHWMIVGPCAGLGLTLAAADWMEGTRSAALEGPLTLAFFLLVAMRFAFDLPAELRASWMFQIAGGGGAEDAARAAKKTMAMFVFPVAAGTAVGYSIVYGKAVGLACAAFVWLVSLILTEALLVEYRKIPFTCARAPGKRNPAVVFAGLWIAFTIFTSVAAGLEGWTLGRWWRTPETLAGLAAVWWFMRWEFDGRRGRGRELVFVDKREAEVLTLGIG